METKDATDYSGVVLGVGGNQNPRENGPTLPCFPCKKTDDLTALNAA